MSDVVRLTRRCNNLCRGCPWVGGTSGPPPDAEPAEVLERLRQLREGGAQRIVLAGGEPTMAVTLGLAVAEARALGFPEVAIVTNGRRLADARYTDRLVRGGLTHATATLHSHDPARHDDVTGIGGSFAETTDGIVELVRRGVEVTCLRLLRPDERVDLGRRVDLRRYVDLAWALGASGVEVRRWAAAEAGGGRREAPPAAAAADDPEAIAALGAVLAYASARGLQVRATSAARGGPGMRYYH